VKITPYKMYHPRTEVEALDSHGQSWHNETVKENIDLCRYQLIESIFRKYLPRTGKILEAGCGLGRWVFYLRNLGYDITGIDLAADALRLAKEYDPSVPIHADNILRTSYPNGSFDAIISLGVVEHFEEGPEEAFRETRRLLKEGGLFLVTIPIQNLNRRMIANPLKEFKRWMNKRKGTEYIFEEYRYSRGQFQTLLEEMNFEIVLVVPDDFVPPKNIGLYVDYPFFRHKKNKWELNYPGKLMNSIFSGLSPWTVSAGALWICRKR
jgi:SAM-dependent methyltransferase